MPNPFFSAFLPSLTQSLTGGAVGALQGQMQGEDRALEHQLKQAQIEQAKAHAYHYLHQQKMSQMAAAKLQELLTKNPDALNTPEGRMYAYAGYGHFDPAVQDARALELNQRAFSNTMLGGKRAAEGAQTSALTEPKVASTWEQAYQRGQAGELSGTRSADILATQPGRLALTQAKAKSEGALQNLRNWQANLAKEKAELQKQLTKAGQGGKSLSLYSYASLLNDRINDMLEAGVSETDPRFQNTVAAYDDVRSKIRAKEFVPVPLGSPGMASTQTGQLVQPEVPPTPGGLLSKPTPGIPGTTPSQKPLNLTPKSKASGRPGAQEHEQAVLKARKLITERGQKFAEEQLKSNKALTPTEKLALKEALLLEAGQR